MNIVTIFDYDTTNPHHKIMLRMFVDSIKLHCVKYPYNLWIITKQINTIDHLFSDTNIITVSKKPNDQYLLPNIKHKLFYLTQLDFEFIYLDYDTYICSDLAYLWDRRKDKPFIATTHQSNIKKHTDKLPAFMNSGLQIISDNSFLNFDKLIEFGQKLNFRFDVPGTDQALLHHYMQDIGYNYLHPEIGHEWNSCAGYGIVTIDDEYNFHIEYQNGSDKYPVRINHYWDEFKPWQINCPIFEFYKTCYA